MDDNQEYREYENIVQQSEGCSPEACAGCPGCGEPIYYFEGTNVGKTVRVHYIGSFDDGTEFASSYEADAPIEFVCGTGQMISGFDRAAAELSAGDIVEIHLEPEEAYGMPRPEMIITVKKETVEGSEGVEAGDKVVLTDDFGRPFDALVTAVDDENITFDCNHEMAGKSLNFRIEMLEIR